MRISFCYIIFIVSIVCNILMAQLHQAILDNNLDNAKCILDKVPCLINAPDVAYGGSPPLILAASLGKKEIVELLLAHGAKHDITDITEKRL